MKRSGDSLAISPLQNHHLRAEFDCGVASLNEFLQRFARQNQDKSLSRTFVAALENEPTKIVGFYTLSGGALSAEMMPREKLPRYPVPVAHLGRLAVDQKFQSRGIGEFLLLDALRRCAEVAEGMGIYAVEVVAINEAARSFYEKYGFMALSDDALHLYLAMKTVARLGLLIKD